jgi:cytochrome o ubiquinol oxidase subunit II
VRPVHAHPPARRLARTLTVIAVLGALGGCAGSFLQPAGPIARSERLITVDALVIMLAIVVPTIIATLVIPWWFRASNQRAHYRPDWIFSGRIEIVTWSIPALVIFFLGGIAWISSHRLDPAEPLTSQADPLEIDVVSLDWKWLFIYPEEHVASINRLVVPAGVPLRFRLTSATVWNVFWVPRLGSMLYCMYGMLGTLYLQADHPGTYLGMSAMISGDGFATMHFDTDALPPQQFAAWARATQESGPVLDETAYRALLRPSRAVAPYSYRAVAPDLFAAIVLQRLPPGYGTPVGAQ